jgi:pescadillo protein
VVGGLRIPAARKLISMAKWPLLIRLQVPTDVDFRILLTFLDLYRTLVSFTLYKLYTDENLVYPPPLDVTLDESGEGVGAFRLVEKAPAGVDAAVIGENGKRVTKKEVRRQIKGIQSTGAGAEGDAMDEDEPAQAEVEADEDFVDHPSKSAVTEDVSTAPLPTYTSLLASTSAAALSSKANLLFSSYTFYLSRETSSRTWEFVIRALGGRVVLSLTSPSPSTAAEADSITHVLIDRPMEPARMREMEQGRKWTWVQPQWVADCCNQGRVLGKENYGPGEALPPHLSPWDGEGEAVRPWLDAAAVDGHVDEADEEEEGMEVDEAMGSEDEDEEEQDVAEVSYPPALLASSLEPSNTTLLHAAELEAEATGVPHATFRANLKDAIKANAAEAKALASEKARKGAAKQSKDEDLRKIMMSGKKAKLYEKMKYSNREKQEEVCVCKPCAELSLTSPRLQKELLESKRLALDKKRRKEARIMSIGKGGAPRK